MPRKTFTAAERERERHHASMRPRPDAAENAKSARSVAAYPLASMRPRPDAAENPGGQTATGSASPPGFNEAAARCRGKLRGCGCWPSGWWRFNEAAARCRGKPLSSSLKTNRVGRALQ